MTSKEGPVFNSFRDSHMKFIHVHFMGDDTGLGTLLAMEVLGGSTGLPFASQEVKLGIGQADLPDCKSEKGRNDNATRFS